MVAADWSGPGMWLLNIYRKIFTAVPNDSRGFNLSLVNAPASPACLSGLERHSVAPVASTILSPSQLKPDAVMPPLSAAFGATMPVNKQVLSAGPHAASMREQIGNDAHACGLAVFLDPTFIRPTASSRAAAPPSSAELKVSLQASQLIWDTGACEFYSMCSKHISADNDNMIQELDPELYLQFIQYQCTHSSVNDVEPTVPKQAHSQVQAQEHAPDLVHEQHHAPLHATVPVQEQGHAHEYMHEQAQTHAPVSVHKRKHEHTPVQSFQSVHEHAYTQVHAQEHAPGVSMQEKPVLGATPATIPTACSTSNLSATLSALSPRFEPEHSSGGVRKFSGLKSVKDNSNGVLAQMEAAWHRQKCEAGGALFFEANTPIYSPFIAIPTFAGSSNVFSFAPPISVTSRIRVAYIPNKPNLSDLPTKDTMISYAATSTFTVSRFVSSFFPFHVILGDG